MGTILGKETIELKSVCVCHVIRPNLNPLTSIGFTISIRTSSAYERYYEVCDTLWTA